MAELWSEFYSYVEALLTATFVALLALDGVLSVLGWLFNFERPRRALPWALALTFIWGGFEAWRFERERADTLAKSTTAAQPEASTKSEPPAVKPNKFACETTISPLLGKGKHGLLIELGVRREKTSGFYAAVWLNAEPVAYEWWIGPSLRTDRQPPPGMNYGSDSLEGAVYKIAMQPPDIAPGYSLYLYFEGESPLVPLRKLFIEDFAAKGDLLAIE